MPAAVTDAPPALPADGLKRARAVGLVLTLGVSQIVAFGSTFYLFGVLGEPIAASLHMKPGLVFAGLSEAMLISAALSAPLGRVIDRVGAKPVLLTALMLLATGLAALAAAPSPPAFFTALAVMGAGMSASLYFGPNALAVEVFGVEARRPITVISLVGGVGSSTTWLLTPHLAHTVGWRGTCLCLAALLGCVVVPALALLAPKAAPHARDRGGAAKVVWDRRMLQLAVLFTAAWFLSAGMGSNLPRLLAATGLPIGRAAQVAGLLGFAAVSARLVELTILRGVAPVAAVRTAALLPSLGAVSVGALGAAAAPVFVVMQGLANGVLSVANGALPLRLWGREGYATRAGLLNTPAKFLQTAGPITFAFGLDQGLPGTLLLVIGVSLVMAAATFRLERA